LDFNRGNKKKNNEIGRAFQSLFSWILTIGIISSILMRRRISILVFLDFNEVVDLNGMGDIGGNFNPCFLGF